MVRTFLYYIIIIILTQYRKEESKKTVENYEELMEEARKQLVASQRKIDQLNEKCIELSTVKEDLMSELTTEKRNQSKLHLLVRNAETRAQTSALQVQDLLARERQVLNEKKDLRKTMTLNHEFTFNLTCN